MAKNGLDTKVAVIFEKLDSLKCDVADVKKDIFDIKITLKEDYITREEFEPIKKIIYGIIALFAAMIVTAIGVVIFK